ncbi:MAG: AmmeMemoRadiSam system protein B [Rhodocyclales bacterium]|nr:AmmeMemoRadiSam system protein B [Rhodocyclales bacterium]
MASITVRPAAVAGQFYPADARQLGAQIATLLAAAQLAEYPLEAPKALVVPHAGYIYSGPVAALGYASVARLRDTVRRVVLLGPAHRMAVRNFVLPATHAFATPLGTIPLDDESWHWLQRRAEVVVDDRPHALEHCLEVQLPFLQSVLDGFSIVPLLVGDATPDAVAELLDALWGGRETLIVISSDLSHYHPYHDAQALDRATAGQITTLQGDLQDLQACGARPINGLLHVARRRGLKPLLLDLRNSGDTAGDRSRVVGYTSIAFYEPDDHEHPVRH